MQIHPRFICINSRVTFEKELKSIYNLIKLCYASVRSGGNYSYSGILIETSPPDRNMSDSESSSQSQTEGKFLLEILNPCQINSWFVLCGNSNGMKFILWFRLLELLFFLFKNICLKHMSLSRPALSFSQLPHPLPLRPY